MNKRTTDGAAATGSPPSQDTTTDTTTAPTTQPSTRSNEPVGPNDGPALTQRVASDASRVREAATGPARRAANPPSGEHGGKEAPPRKP
ncbi:hypothetical protein [Variovorax sp. EBFNA2]|uniref:hypothetical protein n=1 Tax=Variovorax sp. EBFNA2 TaxID=3342097 RepID=UPI0029C0FEE4|nr:hypothetical protein [Variovorax boronicumulans]WPG40170.1 hypothetical protein RZE79_12725 [Variovorax boronicumulans]